MGMRKHMHEGSGGVNLGLIITPMLDMSFQILSFFIMTYNPSALEGHIAGSLAPPENIAQTAPKDNQPPPDFIPVPVDPALLLAELQEALTVIIKTGGAVGQPDKLLLKRKTEPAPQQIADATVKWDQAKQDLTGRLKQFKKESGGDDIKIEADADLQQQYVIEIYDVCKHAGFNKIHFVPPPLVRQANR